MRSRALLPLLLLAPAVSAPAQVSISIGLPHMNIGINVPVMPELVPVPGNPCYYAPQMDANYFFYDGMYWVFRDDNWYASSWYNGPWAAVHPEAVPDFILRIPVGYYRRPPTYFGGWAHDAPPRWDAHWGRDWSARRPGWNAWDRRTMPPPAQVPVYQRNFRGQDYPGPERQQAIHSQNYHYEPRERVVRDHYALQAEHDRNGPRGGREHEHEEEGHRR